MRSISKGALLADNPVPTRPVLGAIAVVIHDGHALLVKRGKAPALGYWGFPGGHVELGETALAAALRELREETGVHAANPQYLTNVDVLRRDSSGAIAGHYLLAAVLCDYGSGTPRAGDDAAAAEWVPLNEIAEGRRSPMNDRVQSVTDLALRVLRARQL